jgi:inosine/xanthosine triphosphate pyrophosphatase family protein
MNKIVFFPTNNIGKFNRYKESFEKIGMQYRRYYTTVDGTEIKVEVKEDGKTLKENACKKAKAYYEEYKKYLPQTQFSIITTDEALYIDGLSDEEQPGMFVRRFRGLDSVRATDEEVVERYTKFVKKIGGETKAKWVYFLVMYDGKDFRDYTWDEEVLFSDTPHYPITKGYVLNNITIVEKDGDNNIMLSDLSEEERYKYLSKFTDTVARFVNNGMHKEIER